MFSFSRFLSHIYWISFVKMIDVLTDVGFCISNINRLLRLLMIGSIFFINVIKLLKCKAIEHEELYKYIVIQQLNNYTVKNSSLKLDYKTIKF